MRITGLSGAFSAAQAAAHSYRQSTRYNYHHPLFGAPLKEPRYRWGNSAPARKHDCAREIARRTRQIAAGSLRRENGFMA